MPQRLPAALALAALLAVAPPAAAAEPGLEARALELANAARARAGMPALAVDAELAAAAAGQAEAMRAAGRVHHSAMHAPGERWWRVAENVGAGFDVDSVHAAFLDSPPHRAALLGDFHRIGVSVAAEQGLVWVVVRFGSLRHPEPPVPAAGSGLGFADTATARWRLPGAGAFTYGNPGDHPIAGDWDCDGVDTPGLYRRSNGYVYLRNTNSTGIAHIRFYFGDPGDLPVAGDFDGDGCDTVGLYRQSTGRFYVIDRLGNGERGLGAADRSIALGGPGSVPLAADFDGDGVDDPAVHDPATGRVTIAGSGGAATSRTFGDPGDVVVAADWDGDGMAGLAAWRPVAGVVHFEDLAPGSMVVGPGPRLHPVAGAFGR